MSSVSSFKFTKDCITRRVTFSANVTWSDIALKLASLYNLPLEFIGVSYIDSDGDEITISTQEELQDYYRFRGITASNEPLKFTVVDLRSLRAADSHDKPLPETPPHSHPLRSNPSRNTFGTIPFTYEEDEEWRRIPGFKQLFDPPTDSIRFVELASDAKSSLNDGSGKKRSSSGSVETANTARAKPHTGDDDISSIDSVIGNVTPRKHPVHVYDRSVPTPARERNSTTASSSATEAVPDPPLPDLEPGPTSISSPSLTNDVATLLSTITAAFSSHPELAECLRTILRHAGSGSYWAAHREQVSRAVEQIRRSSQDIQTQMMNAASTNFDAENQASRRIAEAVANIVRSLSQMASDPHNPSDPSSANHIPTPDFSFHSCGARVPPPPTGAHPPHPPHPPLPPRPPRFSHPDPPPPHPPHGYHHSHFPLGRWGRHMPPHDPSAPWPLWRGSQGGPPVVPWAVRSESAQSPHPPPRSQPPILDVSEDDSDDGQGIEISMYGISPQPSPRVQKEKLLAAKAAYIAEKQKYRQEKQARRREREGVENNDPSAPRPGNEPAAQSSTVHVSGDALPASQLISHGRGEFPPLEHFSISRRHTSHVQGRGRSSRQPSGSANAELSRTRIRRRLSDMGFSGPSVERRVSLHVPDINEIRERAAEDTIVSSVVDELLTETPQPEEPTAANH